jgi:hypothetical protein
MRRWILLSLITAACIGLTTQAHAQPRVGEKMPEFELQSTEGKFHGTKNATGKVSVLFFVGYN